MMNAVEETEVGRLSFRRLKAPPESSARPSGSPEAASQRRDKTTRRDARYNTSEARVTVLLAKGALLMSVMYTLV